MEKLKFIIQEKKDQPTEVKIICSHSCAKTANDFLVQLFPVEMFSSTTTKNEISTFISINTTNKEMVESLRKMISQWFRKKSHLNNINLN